jgi:polysaccharide deacetylase family protein (PEP-CTERM system associated)
MTNVMTVDVEEYFHPTEIQPYAPMARWMEMPSRILPEVEAILQMLNLHRARATFFVLGWVARYHPGVVRRIVEEGHEVGCHSFAHRLVFDLSPAEFRADTLLAMRVIEDAGGCSPRVYRAPSYSVTARSMWALEILAECGFTHDSSIYPIAHDRYGIPGFARHARTIETPSGPIHEVPVATAKVLGDGVAPVGGGAYLRLLPYAYIAAGIRRINATEGEPACVYVHPWELDADVPRLAQNGIARLRTYTGLPGMKSKFGCLLRDFRFGPLCEIHPVAAGAPFSERPSVLSLEGR